MRAYWVRLLKLFKCVSVLVLIVGCVMHSQKQSEVEEKSLEAEIMMKSDLENLNFRKVYVDGAEITRERLFSNYHENVLRPKGLYDGVSPVFIIISDDSDIWVEFLYPRSSMGEPDPGGWLLHWGERQFFLLTEHVYEKDGIYIWVTSSWWANV